MPALHDLQSTLTAQIRAGVAAPDGLVAKAGPLATPARLLIHQRHVRTSLTAALRTRFPALVRLVGDGFFAFLAAQFISTRPPADPRIARYGDALPDFLDDFEPARAWPWLSDVARIENMAFAVADAPRVEALDPAAMASVPVERAADLLFLWNPAVRLFASPQPAGLLWRAARDDGAEIPVDLQEAGPTRLCLRRGGNGVEARDLTSGDYAFLAAIAAGAPLDAAAATAIATDSRFALPPAIASLLSDGCVTGFLLEGSSP